MPTFRKSSSLPVDRATLFAWHARPGALERLLPPWQPMRVIANDGSIRDGARVTTEIRLLPGLWKRWMAEHFGYVEGEQFCDRQLAGPFKSFVHTHRMMADASAHAQSVLHDEMEYELPLGAMGRLLGTRRVVRELERMFAFRHARTHNDLTRHATFADHPRLTVAVSGASGAVARRLMPFLTTGGHSARRLMRTPSTDADAIAWTPATGEVDRERLAGCDAIVHLAGKNIATRWTESSKREMWQSRVDATGKLCETLAAMPRRPRTLIAASAVGYYGDRGDEPLDETCPPGDAWTSEMCVAWENATRPARDAGVRVVNLRIAVVLAADSGAVPKMLTPTRLGIAGRMGDGKQFMPWIAMDDLVYLIHHALMDERWAGPVNANTDSVRQHDFIRTLGRLVHRPTIAPMPAAAVKLIFGQMGREVLLASENVQPTRARELGFVPTFDNLEAALRFELGR